MWASHSSPGLERHLRRVEVGVDSRPDEDVLDRHVVVPNTSSARVFRGRDTVHYGFGEASWWPFVTAIGGSGIYVSAALLVLSMGENALVSQTVGAGAMAGSVGLFLVGIYGWLYHAFVSDFWERGTDYHSDKTLKFAMLLFLGSEIATFGAGFVYYFIVRGGEVWTQAAVPEVFGSLVIVNTLLLIASSVTLHCARRHSEQRPG